MDNAVITIENTEMQIREYNGQRVVTFNDIDAVHQRKSGAARNSFYKHKQHFAENVDYYVVKRENFNVANNHIGEIPPKGLTLLTESGYMMLVKPFSDDLSWAVQRQLVNAYFRTTSDTALVQTDLADNRLHQTSSTPLPKNPSWYARNLRNMEIICTATHKPMSYLAHKILVRVGEEYNMDEAKKIYEKELGEPPKYPLDIINYFPELAEIATDYVRKLVLQIVKDEE